MSMDEQDRAALRESVRAALDNHAGDEHWRLLTEIGLPAIDVPEQYGGLGAGLGELVVAAGELGRCLSPAPLLGTVLATRLLRQVDAESQLRDIAQGVVFAVAWTGPDGRWTTDSLACKASGTVSGIAHYVLDGAIAGRLLVLANDGHGIGLYQVDPAAVRRTDPATMDLSRPLAVLEFAGTPARRLGTVPDLDGARGAACVVLAAEQAGAAERALDITVEYTKQRHQFGRPIGSFQALKHRMADCHVGVQTARSIVTAAAGTFETRPELAAAAHAHATAVFNQVTAEMIQMHGGIGITWEHDAHRYFKRAHADAQLFGTYDEELHRFAADTMAR
jgi:alkylation response protein AidB-like acyl-CoA dehydrogenase